MSRSNINIEYAYSLANARYAVLGDAWLAEVKDYEQNLLSTRN